MDTHPERTPTDSGVEIRFLEEKSQSDSSTIIYQQTFLGLPVWGATLSIHIERNPDRIIGSQFSGYSEINAKKPSDKSLENCTKIAASDLGPILGLEVDVDATLPRIESQRLIIYKYDAAKRIINESMGKFKQPIGLKDLTLPLPPVAETIKAGQFYVACEIIFVLPIPHWRKLRWFAIVEIENRSVLYLRPDINSFMDGRVFKIDPATSIGATAQDGDTVLINACTNERLQGLKYSPDQDQTLSGDYVEITDYESPSIAPPSEQSSVFNYQPRTDNFAAVNAYYHCDRFIRLVNSLGLPSDYFNKTVFPIPIDHRGRYLTDDGIEVNAHCEGGNYGITYAGFCLADVSSPIFMTNPLGIASDWRVVLHELGGHGILYCHINSANFRFSHSAGDSFAAILNDPGSRALNRFETFPFENFGRWHNRDAKNGWGWGGAHDDAQYDSEQILATTMFRIYRSIGGDSSDNGTQTYAAQYMAYLMLRTVYDFTQDAQPNTAQEFAEALILEDKKKWIRDHWATPGGAYGKVIRWAFEKQGAYQGQPPDVDVYIDDGRQGEYQYQPDYLNCRNIWNRRNPDGGIDHQDPVEGETNYAYVKIKNRGTQVAKNVIVQGYQRSEPRALGFGNWPDDYRPMSDVDIKAPDVGPDSADVVVGPIEWIPHLDKDPDTPPRISMLFYVTAMGDPSNADNYQYIGLPIWTKFLVPNDNNIAVRVVDVEPREESKKWQPPYAFAWAWILFIGALMITPEGIWCIKCGSIIDLPGYIGDGPVMVLGIGSILIGIVGLISEIRKISTKQIGI